MTRPRGAQRRRQRLSFVHQKTRVSVRANAPLHHALFKCAQALASASSPPARSAPTMARVQPSGQTEGRLVIRIPLPGSDSPSEGESTLRRSPANPRPVSRTGSRIARRCADSRRLLFARPSTTRPLLVPAHVLPNLSPTIRAGPGKRRRGQSTTVADPETAALETRSRDADTNLPWPDVSSWENSKESFEFLLTLPFRRAVQRKCCWFHHYLWRGHSCGATEVFELWHDRRQGSFGRRAVQFCH